MKITNAQKEQINSMKLNYAQFSTNVNILGNDDKGGVVGELDAPVYNQRFVIGKKGSISWKYKFTKF